VNSEQQTALQRQPVASQPSTSLTLSDLWSSTEDTDADADAEVEGAVGPASLENFRTNLNIRTRERYQKFFYSLQRHVFLDAKNQQQAVEGLRLIWQKHARQSRKLQNILMAINQRREDLFTYWEIKDCPNTTNIIESYNSHLNGRLKTIKGFQRFDSAKRWLNAYLVRRRTKTLTDCKDKFKHLNSHASLELTIKKQAKWPDILTNLGIKKIKYWKKED
jgi:hypothetical protein